MEHFDTSSASTSMEQASIGPNGFFPNASTLQAKGPGTLGFQWAIGQRRFPHVSIPFNYNTDANEEGREADHSQTWNAPPELTHPEVTSHVVPPIVTTSYPIEEEADEVRRSLAQQHLSYKDPQTSNLQGHCCPNHHNNSFPTPTYTHAIPNPTMNFPT